ncbi:MAG: S9 family peptidase [Cyclobacteriaceae bacterium]|nr:S9 family peptidase [Cyclobacteriaceae bacterium]
MNTNFLLLFFGSFLISYPVFPQSISPLTIPEIMKGENYVGYLPEDIRWSDDSKTVYFTWNPEKESLRDLYKVNIRDLEPIVVPLEEQKNTPAAGGDYTRDFSRKVYSKNGDIFLLDINSGNTRQITSTIENEMDPGFTVDEKKVIYRKGNNLFSWSISDGSTIQLTNLSADKPEKEEKIPEMEEWLKKDQLDIFEILSERKEKKDQQEKKNKTLEPDRPLKISIHGKRLMSLDLSPDQKYAVFRLSKWPVDSNGTKVPDYVTESGYVKDLKARPKVGSPERVYELGIFDLNRDTVYYVDPSTIPGIYDKPLFLKEYLPADSTFQHQYPLPREVTYLKPVFNEKGDRSLMVIRSLDNKDRWIMNLNMQDGTLGLLDRQRDEAWIGGPGIGMWNTDMGNVGWLGDDVSAWFQSEATGYSHLYTVNSMTGEKSQLTQGDWEVYEASLSRNKQYFYLVANREGPAGRHFYRLSLADGTMTRHSREPGNYEVKISPDEKMLAVRYSYSNKPWELYLMLNRPGEKMIQATHSTTEQFAQYPWRVPEIIHFEADDGKMVTARLYKPENRTQKGPGVIFVHGAGYLQNAHHWWSKYFREYMFHNFLADHGYTVLDIDYRGSEGYGREWRTGIYRHMGGRDLSDQVDGARYLIENHQVDPSGIGIYGGSYGGFITLFALFKHGDVFKCGAALRSVTDWAHYNHPYASNILNTPVEDSLAYRRSSPIYYAGGLKGELLMLHGMTDTNVQFQDVVRLSQKLIELGKENWNLAVFPLEDHAFKEASSWADEYRRIFELFERNLK